MPVLKNNDVPRTSRDAVVLDLGDLNRQAEVILEHAREEADRIVAEGRAEAQRLIDAADERGYGEGHQRGFREGEDVGRTQGQQEALDQYDAQLSALIAEWTASLESWEHDRCEMLIQAREDVLTLAFELARKIVLKLPEMDPTVVQLQLEETISLLTRPTAISVVVHPEDRKLCEEVLPSLMTSIDQSAHASVEEDESITRGGCVVRCGAGQIDASLEKQLDRIAESLLASGRDMKSSDASA